jgi:hypothetical protein
MTNETYRPMTNETYPGPGEWPAEVTPTGIVPAFDDPGPLPRHMLDPDERLARIREGAARADAELATWLLADPDRANNAAIVVMFATAMIRAAAAEPAEMLAKLYTFNTMLGAVVEYVETGHSSWQGSPWDALAELVS